MKKIFIFGVFIALFSLTITSCKEETGVINFVANGEDFSVNPFISKDGWLIDFDEVLINLNNITAYNINNPELKVSLPGSQLVSFSNSSNMNVGNLSNIPKGNYQSLKFSLKKIDKGLYEGFSIVMIGKAIKEEKEIKFIIKLNEELTFDGKDGYVGDSIKGLLNNKETSVEMTFHFDHIFGDYTAQESDHVNSGSPGFEYFLQFIDDSSLNVDQNQLVDTKKYNTLISSIESLGHLGEGHCEVIR